MVDLQKENARLRAELAEIKGREAYAVATGIQKAIAETRVAFNEGGQKWLCRVADLEQYADRVAKGAVPTLKATPAGWSFEREATDSITVSHPDVGCCVARPDSGVASVLLYQLADDLMEAADARAC